MRERLILSVVKANANDDLDRIINRVEALKAGFKYLSRREFKKIDKALNLLDQSIDKAWEKKKKSPDYVPIPNAEIDKIVDDIRKEYA